ncbi:EamA family transporter [Aquicoccus sp. SCR17]|nr:EamA family transporter [Carideicomes alvinocaridis]
MERQDSIDLRGVAMLVAFSLLLGFNQVVIKVTNGGLQPVFFAGLRSVLSCILLLAWMRWRGIPLGLSRHVLGAGIALGVFFTIEFVALFLALDMTTVSRASIMFYTMPLWTALGAHFLIPGERLTGLRLVGFLVALAGVAWAMADRGTQGQASLAGDLLGLVGALGWAGIALSLRASRAAELQPEQQLLWQLLVSVPLILGLTPFFGPLIRDLAPIHLAGLGFQALFISFAGFLFWFFLLKRYPASGVASFGFLTPVFAVGMGWALLGEPLGPHIVAALALVAVGLVLINRRPGPGRGAGRAVPRAVAEGQRTAQS